MQGTASIKKWLEGTRPYSDGVALYCAYGADMKLKLSLVRGENEYSKKALAKALEEMVAAAPPATLPTAVVPPDLLAVVTNEAHTTWKELMNKRAVLLSLCRNASPMDENDAASVAVRGKLALEILQYNKEHVLPAYDKLDYVRVHGKLPAIQPKQEVDESVALVPDHLVKQHIDNLRKNLSKLRKRPATAERVAIISTHEKHLNQLLERWACLK